MTLSNGNMGETLKRVFWSLLVIIASTTGLHSQDVYERLGEALQNEIDRVVKDYGMPGLTFSLRLDDEHRYDLAAGFSDVEKKIAMKPGDLMLSGSTGKLFFAAIALDLIEKDKLELDALIAPYLSDRPWFKEVPNHSTIRVEHLLRHTSGLPRHLFQESFMREFSAAPEVARTPEECVQHLCGLEPLFAPGKDWSYSDANFILLGFIIERVTGRSCYELVEEAFIDPLGLAHTIPSSGRTLTGLIPGYVGEQNPFGLPHKVLVDGQLVMDPAFEWTGGGFATNPADLATFVAHIQESDYLDDSTKTHMRTAVSTAHGRPYDSGYGLGCFVWSKQNDTRIGHPGFFPGYVTHVEYSLTRQYTLAIQVNSDDYASYLAQILFEIDEVMSKHLDAIDEAKIRSNFNKQEECWNSGDLECYMAAYAPHDEITTVSKAGVTSGYDKILRNYQTYFPESRMGHLYFDELTFKRLTDSFYYVNGRFNLKFDDREDLVQGFFSVVMKKIKGEWYMITDHSS